MAKQPTITVDVTGTEKFESVLFALQAAWNFIDANPGDPEQAKAYHVYLETRRNLNDGH